MMHSSDRAPLRNIVHDLREARNDATLAYDDTRESYWSGQIQAYDQALLMLEKRFPELFHEPRPSLASQS